MNWGLGLAATALAWVGSNVVDLKDRMKERETFDGLLEKRLDRIEDKLDRALEARQGGK